MPNLTVDFCRKMGPEQPYPLVQNRHPRVPSLRSVFIFISMSLNVAPQSYLAEGHICGVCSGGKRMHSLLPRTWQNQLCGKSQCKPVTVLAGPINTYSQVQRQPGHKSLGKVMP